MATRLRRLLVAGGAGFLGSAFVRDRLKADPEVWITVLDAIRRPTADAELREQPEDPRLQLVQGDVCDQRLVLDLAKEADAIVNFASDEFFAGRRGRTALARTDVEGTTVLLEAVRVHRLQRFLLVSTADVFGPQGTAPHGEEDPLMPRTPAAASRSAAGLMARAYHASFGVPVLLVHAAAAYGPRQPVDQPVAAMITSALCDLPFTVEAGGAIVRDYLHVDDVVAGIARVLWKGEPGTSYNLGGDQISLGDLGELILRLCGKPSSLKRVMKEGAKGSYGLDSRRMRPLGWVPRMSLNEGLRTTVDWFRRNEAWWRVQPSAA